MDAKLKSGFSSITPTRQKVDKWKAATVEANLTVFLILAPPPKKRVSDLKKLCNLLHHFAEK